ncbi:MAG: hypothetical protein KHX03_04840 [Clostridium sp.]|nr:hypothetical protein [Clostridium sp.]
MIRLDIDLSYLTKNFQIGTQRVNEYSTKSIDEIMEAEAAQGNTQAASFQEDVLNDPKELVKLFKLQSARNRYAILSNMNSQDLEYLVQFLEPGDLLMGLMFFTKEKILNLIYDLPKDKICSILFNAFSPEQFLKMIPEKEINKFFDSDKLDKNQILDYVKTLPEDKLNKMMQKYMYQETGKTQDDLHMSKEQVVKFMDQLEPEKFKTALKCFEREEKMGLILELTQKDPKLFTEFSKNALTMPLTQLDKGEIVKNMNKLEPEDLMKMVNELPDDILAVVVTQIDPMVFAELLSKNFQDILAEIGIGNI